MNKYPFIFIFIVGVILTACGDDDTPTTTIDQEVQLWLDSSGISASFDENTGIYYYPDSLNPGGSQVSNGRVAAIYYTLTDLDGNTIASHQPSDGDSLLFKVGVSAVYPIGVDFGVSLMRVGEVYNFILPPSQAYLNLTSGAINSNLIAHLKIQLVAVHNEADIFAQDTVDIRQYIDDNNLNNLSLNPTDSIVKYSTGIVYKRRSRGTGNIPSNGDTVVVDYTGRFLDDTGFASDGTFEWVFGSDEPRELLSGFEFGVSLMQTNERALIMIPSSEGYRESALIIPAFITGDLIEDDIIPDYVSTIPPYSTLLFEVDRTD
ncbi:FKBP-type peptidyl-prolyl cis-trans isomerase [Ekhidna sp.]|uniref:FKBP-type peptidyl-prolyl cis-trans isomerase n=1 Tax=Ekhidna sp. TaxID=2608089 RepID=UPI003CCBBFF9